jgi:hypothetical protein
LKLDLKDVVGDGSLLPHDLVQTMVLALCVCIHTMIVTGRLAVNAHAKADPLAVGR